MKARIVIEANKVVGYQLVEDNSPVPGQFRGGLMAVSTLGRSGCALERPFSPNRSFVDH